MVATQFPHAKELLAGGAGLLVPHRDPAAIATALRSVITRGDVMTRMTAAATAAAPQLLGRPSRSSTASWRRLVTASAAA